MEKKRILMWERDYVFDRVDTDKFDILMVALQSNKKKVKMSQGYNVVACFEEEYDSLPIAEIPDNYLDHSWDSDRFLRHFSYTKRREILGKEISFWKKVLDEYKPDCFINEIVTIEFIEVLYIECKKRNIPYLAPCPSFRMPHTFWLKSPYNSLFSKDELESIKPSADDYKKAEEYIEKNRAVYVQPYYVRNLHNSIWNCLRKFGKEYLYALRLRYYNKIKGGFLYEDHTPLHKVLVDATLFRIFRKHDKPIFNDKIEYILYPLHYEPEACVEYFGYRYNDQASLISTLAHSLGTNQVLVVKEHPQQIGVLLTGRFQDIKKRHCNLMYLSGDIKSYDIFDSISSLVTLNGTIGLEYWVRKKPVVILGDVFFSNFPGMTHCNGFTSLQDTLRNHKYLRASDEDIREYVAKMFSLMFPMNFLLTATEKEIKELSLRIEEYLDGINEQNNPNNRFS